MRIALDAMGGDHAPGAVVEGALLRARGRAQGERLVLFGHEGSIRGILGEAEGASRLEIVHAPEAIGMEEAGPRAIRRKKEASLAVAMRALAEEEVDAVVSAGNSAAVVATARHFVGLARGLRRPCLMVFIPTPRGRVLVADAGAYLEADALQLAQWAVLAHHFLKARPGLERPRVGLLNIGREAGKGPPDLRRAHDLLSRSSLRFAGNLEPRDLLSGRADAVICNGFAGNVLLKLFEALCESLFSLWQERLQRHAFGESREFVRDFEALRRTHHYGSVGGVPLVGVRGTVVVAHGRSDARAVCSAIDVAADLASENVFQRIAEALSADPLLARLKTHDAQGMLGRWKSKWGLAGKK